MNTVQTILKRRTVEEQRSYIAGMKAGIKMLATELDHDDPVGNARDRALRTVATFEKVAKG